MRTELSGVMGRLAGVVVLAGLVGGAGVVGVVGVGCEGRMTRASDMRGVGPLGDGRVMTPVNQELMPHGVQLALPGMRPQAVAMSPDGTIVVTAGKTNELVVVDAAKAEVRQRVTLPGEPTGEGSAGAAAVSAQVLKPDKSGQLSYTGLIFAPDGKRIYMSNVDGSIKVFDVGAGGVVSPRETFLLMPAEAPRRKAEIPSGLAITADGTKLYVCGNLSNRLFELDAQTGKTLRLFDVGVAPYDVLLAEGKAFVSNWGGRRPGPDDQTGPAGRGTVVRVDPVRNIASEGSVSVIDLGKGAVSTEIVTGLHASGMSRTGRMLVVCNAGSDYLSVIDTRLEQEVAKIWAKGSAADLLGAAPNAAAFDASGKRLYIANGSQNAVAVIGFDTAHPGESQLLGMIPVGWYPGAVLVDNARERIVVANIKGLPVAPQEYREGAVPLTKGYNSHHYFGSLTFSPRVGKEELGRLSREVARNLQATKIAESLLPPRRDVAARVIPERIGEPSRIKHVVYIIKENRTYDQVFGAFGRGNGDASLCIFGREVTPNHHAIAERYVLLDNTYCCGILSADGHEWSMTAYSTDYMERSFAGFPRSYPDGQGEDENDALAYAPSGFLWDNALKHGVTIRNFGEFMGPAVRWREASKKGTPDFMTCYKAWQDGAWREGKGDVVFESWPSLERMRPFSPTTCVGWEMSVPDQFRADYFLRDLAEQEAKGTYPQLTLICLPQDHTSGTSEGCPTPAACVADNDLALGRIVEGLSKSRFWPEMAVFVIEDDPQAGWDHVSGYRTVSLVASPFAKRGEVVSTQYNTTSILRTIEQILGLPPMNAFDASATPMFDCFTEEADEEAYAAVANAVPLDQMNPKAVTIKDGQARRDALASAAMNFRQADRAPEDELNRILWRAMRGPGAAYPEWAAGVKDDDD